MYPAYGLEKLVLLKCPCYSKQSIDSVQSYQNTNGIFTQLEQIIPKFVGTTKDNKWTKLKVSHFQISNYYKAIVIEQMVPATHRSME